MAILRRSSESDDRFTRLFGHPIYDQFAWFSRAMTQPDSLNLWMDSTPYGSQYYETPNMKRLERQSMRFTDAYAVPLCSPKLSGPLTLKLRVRSSSGGEGRVQWKTAAQESFPESAQSVAFDLPAGTDWQDVTVHLPRRIPNSSRVKTPSPFLSNRGNRSFTSSGFLKL